MDHSQLPLTDHELVQKACRGDRQAFHALVDRHAGWLFGLASSLVGNAADAEDVLQETFAGAYRGLRGFRQQATVKTWLTQILVRQVARHHRSAGRRQADVDYRPADRRGPLDAQHRSDLRMDLDKAIGALSGEHREVIVLRELQGLSYDEISAVLSLPRGTVESRLFRARRALAELLKEYLA